MAKAWKKSPEEKLRVVLSVLRGELVAQHDDLEILGAAWPHTEPSQ